MTGAGSPNAAGVRAIPVGKFVAAVDASREAVAITVFTVSAGGPLIPLTERREPGIGEILADVPRAVEAVRTLLMSVGVRHPSDVHAIHLGGEFAGLAQLRNGLGAFGQILDPLPTSPRRPRRTGRTALVIGLVAVLVVAAGAVAAYFGIRALGGADSAPPLAVRASIPVGNIPEHIAVQGDTAYVADIDNTVWIVDLAAKAVLGQIPIASYGRYIAGLAIDTRTHQLIVAANSGSKAELVMIDMATRQITGTVPLGDDFADTLGFDPGLRQVYVGTGSDDHSGTTVVTADIDARALTGSLPVAKGHGNIEVDPANHKVYIADGKSIAILDGVTRSRIGSIDTGAGSIALDAPRHMLYAGTSDDATDKDKYETFVKVIDLNSATVTATIPSGMQGYELHVDPADGTVYVTSGWSTYLETHDSDICNEGWLTAIDPKRETTTGKLCLGGSSMGLPAAVDPTNHQVYALAGRNLVVAGR